MESGTGSGYRAPAALLALLRIRSIARDAKGKPSTGPEVSNQSAHLQSYRLLHFNELPVWYQDNPFIRTAYRPISQSTLRCLQSICHLHNETINILTHLVPSILFLCSLPILHRRIAERFPDATKADHLVFSLNVLAAATTMLLSATYHTLMNHSFTWSTLWLRIDYVGILTLILASFISGIYVGFYCNPFLQKVYWSMIISLSLISGVLVVHPRLQGMKYRSYRTWAFVLTGLSGFAPVIHGLYLYGWEEMWVRSGMPYWYLEGAVYLIGAFSSRREFLNRSGLTPLMSGQFPPDLPPLGRCWSSGALVWGLGFSSLESAS